MIIQENLLYLLTSRHPINISHVQYFSHHGPLIDRTLAGVSVARALPAHGDVPQAVEVLAQPQLLHEVVQRLLVLRQQPQLLQSQPDESGLGEVHQGLGGAGGSGTAVHQANMNLE